MTADPVFLGFDPHEHVWVLPHAGIRLADAVVADAVVADAARLAAGAYRGLNDEIYVFTERAALNMSYQVRQRPELEVMEDVGPVLAIPC
jgi:hypothetical protein